MIANWKTGAINPRFEPPTGPGQTIPDQVIPLSEIVARFVRGDSTVSFPGVFDESFPPGFENLDTMERLEMSKAIDEGIKDVRERVQRRAEQARKPKPKPNKAEEKQLPAGPGEGGTTE